MFGTICSAQYVCTGICTTSTIYYNCMFVITNKPLAMQGLQLCFVYVACIHHKLGIIINTDVLLNQFPCTNYLETKRVCRFTSSISEKYCINNAYSPNHFLILHANYEDIVSIAAHCMHAVSLFIDKLPYCYTNHAFL